MRLVCTLPVLIALALAAPARADDQPMPVHKVTQAMSGVSDMLIETLESTLDAAF